MINDSELRLSWNRFCISYLITIWIELIDTILSNGSILAIYRFNFRIALFFQDTDVPWCNHWLFIFKVLLSWLRLIWRMRKVSDFLVTIYDYLVNRFWLLRVSSSKLEGLFCVMSNCKRWLLPLLVSVYISGRLNICFIVLFLSCFDCLRLFYLFSFDIFFLLLNIFLIFLELLASLQLFFHCLIFTLSQQLLFCNWSLKFT